MGIPINPAPAVAFVQILHKYGLLPSLKDDANTADSPKPDAAVNPRVSGDPTVPPQEIKLSEAGTSPRDYQQYKGSYPAQTIREIAQAAKEKGIDPRIALAVSMAETRLGKQFEQGMPAGQHYSDPLNAMNLVGSVKGDSTLNYLNSKIDSVAARYPKDNPLHQQWNSTAYDIASKLKDNGEDVGTNDVLLGSQKYQNVIAKYPDLQPQVAKLNGLQKDVDFTAEINKQRGNYIENNMIPLSVEALKEKMSSAHSDDSATQLQAYNGFGKLPAGYYGSKVPIDTRQTPIYGNQVLDIADKYFTGNPVLDSLIRNK